MAYRYDEFAPGEIYHLYTRGVEQRTIFRSDRDRVRFLELLVHCLPPEETMSYSTARKLGRESELTKKGRGLVDVLCYCLMDNHFHLLIRENIGKGTSVYMQRVLNSYAKFFNLSQRRSGPLFIRPFKAVLIDGDDYFLQVSRYIHLNPYIAHMTKNPLEYRWSSLSEYTRPTRPKSCHTSLLHSMVDAEEYKEFVRDHADYARSLADTQHLLIDYDD